MPTMGSVHEVAFRWGLGNFEMSLHGMKSVEEMDAVMLFLLLCIYSVKFIPLCIHALMCAR